MNLNGKVVIVTGAKSGIGLATAARFAEENAMVVLADIKESQKEASEITKRGGRHSLSKWMSAIIHRFLLSLKRLLPPLDASTSSSTTQA